MQFFDGTSINWMLEVRFGFRWSDATNSVVVGQGALEFWWSQRLELPVDLISRGLTSANISRTTDESDQIKGHYLSWQDG